MAIAVGGTPRYAVLRCATAVPMAVPRALEGWKGRAGTVRALATGTAWAMGTEGIQAEWFAVDPIGAF